MDVLPKIPAGCTEQTWEDAIIRKGYVRRGYISERVGLYPEVRFVYTPLIPEEVDSLEDAVGKLKEPSHTSRLVAKRLVVHLKSWSLGPNISQGDIACLGNELFNRLRLIICQRLATDIDPLWPEATKDGDKGVDELLGESFEPSASV